MLLSNYSRKITNDQFTVIGHRGDGGSAPENTLAAIEKGIQAGANMLEIDVHETRDGVVCVMHDERVNRTTNGQGKIKDLTWDEIRQLDAGSWFNAKYRGEQVPSLEQVIEHIDGRAQLLIEIKKGTPYYPQIEEKVVSLIRKHQAESWCVVQSFHMDILQHIHQLDPNIRLQKLAFFAIPALGFSFDLSFHSFHPEQESFIESYNLNYLFVTKKLIRQLHQEGKKINVWTADSPGVIRKMVNMGVDGVITNHPELANTLKNKQ
ncbi:glycerophosphoryl diester phosphodiesterase [Prolixibacter bellariivorans]|uniref:Glycerophosphoryl diester phosphodiesterase n=3 Tax=Prolixibacter bellariivorans TaxID=314319 RepID=A0A5M4B4D0_9BACT|nr:glycerophosphoryl diester phosphodiesterase [Prolixibacter bellariivorans]